MSALITDASGSRWLQAPGWQSACRRGRRVPAGYCSNLAIAAAIIKPQGSCQGRRRRDQKAGISSWPKATTGTPRVSSASSVLGMSRMALAPAQTTMTGVRASSSRSAEMSKLVFRAAVHTANAAGGEHRNCRPGAPPSWWLRPWWRRCGALRSAKAKSARESFITFLACASPVIAASSDPGMQACHQ
jgi:hypothetical protein